MFDQMLQSPLTMEQRRFPSSNANAQVIAPNCPRCASPNTKFCYYNNYSLSQPRYFCKSCRRYWTKGGSLRNVPVGGGCRKTRRSKSSKSHSNSNFPKNPPSPSPSGSDNHLPEIDLAAVFANFLNQNNSGSETNENSSRSSSLEIDRENPCDLIDESRFGDVLPRIEDDVEEFLGGEVNGFELQGMIGAELPAPESLPDFVWQMPDFGSLLAEDQLKISNNLIGENWGSFDVPGYELFSRP
ncbi:hypothetical protein LguiA_018317 [Lonicera macranthoides]